MHLHARCPLRRADERALGRADGAQLHQAPPRLSRLDQQEAHLRSRIMTSLQRRIERASQVSRCPSLISSRCQPPSWASPCKSAASSSQHAPASHMALQHKPSMC